MDDIIFQKKLGAQFKSLPRDVQDAILSVDLGKKLADMSKNHALRIDQMNVLENETLFVMMGLESPEKYITNLQKGLGVGEVPARKIAEDINTQVFRPIRESLKKIHRIEQEVAEQPIQSVPPIKPEPREQKTDSKEGGEERLNEEDSSFKIQETTTPLIDHDRFHDTEEPKVKNYELGETPENLPTGQPPAFIPTAEETSADKEREKLLHEIEGHANSGRNTEHKAQSTTKNIVEEKLGGAFRIPPKESEHAENSKVKDEKPSKYGSGDPYREPVG